jgi:DNA polymerase-3 subunit epsilon
MGRHPDLAALPLDLLHVAQEKWAAEQAASLQQYFDSKGQDERVEPAWPVVPPPPIVQAEAA